MSNSRNQDVEFLTGFHAMKATLRSRNSDARVWVQKTALLLTAASCNEREHDHHVCGHGHLQMSMVADNPRMRLAASCNQRGQAAPMFAIMASDVCKRLQLCRKSLTTS
jgi:hypothetical protein